MREMGRLISRTLTVAGGGGSRRNPYEVVGEEIFRKKEKVRKIKLKRDAEGRRVGSRKR